MLKLPALCRGPCGLREEAEGSSPTLSLVQPTLFWPSLETCCNLVHGAKFLA